MDIPNTRYALGLTIKEVTTRRVIPLSEFDDGQSQSHERQLEGDDDDAGAAAESLSEDVSSSPPPPPPSAGTPGALQFHSLKL